MYFCFFDLLLCCSSSYVAWPPVGLAGGMTDGGHVYCHVGPPAGVAGAMNIGCHF